MKPGGLKMRKIPKLGLHFRLLLYFLMVLSATLSLVSVAFECFPYIAEIIIYILAAMTLSVGSLLFNIGYQIYNKEDYKTGHCRKSVYEQSRWGLQAENGFICRSGHGGKYDICHD